MARDESRAAHLAAATSSIPAAERDANGAASEPAPARYFWIATLQWPDPRGPRIWSANGIVACDRPHSRVSVFNSVRDVAEQAGVPRDADVLFFSVEPEMLPGGAG